MVKNFIKLIITFLTWSVLFSQTDVIILSNNVGTEIDEHENRFYRIFPKERGLKNAQIVSLGQDQYRITIVKILKGKETKVSRYVTGKEINKLRTHVDEQPVLTNEALTLMYEGMDFIRAEKIINELPIPQYVMLEHSDGVQVNGTLFNVDKNVLHIQMVDKITRIKLENLNRLSYRPFIDNYEELRPYVIFGTAIFGYALARIYNDQRPTTYNEYGIPRNDLKTYREIFGTIIGLIFSSEVFDAISTLLSPKETIILSEAEYEREYIK